MLGASSIVLQCGGFSLKIYCYAMQQINLQDQWKCSACYRSLPSCG